MTFRNKQLPKISVITVTFNSEKTIEETINSVRSQNYKPIEHIIIDGASSDNTLKIIESYSESIAFTLSEPDKGIYDALNKGLSVATGDIISFLHSDDLYAKNSTVYEVLQYFDDDTQGIYSDLVYTNKYDLNKVMRYWKSCNYNPSLLENGWMPPHPTLFLRRGVYEKYGYFDTSFKISADYDFMLRILKNNIKVKYFPQVTYKMRVGGKSNRSFSNILNKSKEDFNALRKNKLKNPSIILIKKNISKIDQLFKR